MLDILRLLKEKCEEDNPLREDSWCIEKALLTNEDDIFLILREGYIQNQETESMQALSEQYFIVEEYALGRPFISSEFHYSLVHARKRKRKKYRVGVFNGATYNTETMVGATSKLVCPPEYNPSFQRYINAIQDWINNGIVLSDDEDWLYEFAEIDYPQNIRYPRFYSKRSNLVRQLLNVETVERLSDIAEIYEPVENENGETSAVVNIDEERPYRFDNILISYGRKTSVKIQEGDILYPRIAVDAKPFLVTTKTFPDVEAYAGDTVLVIRAGDVIPEYLWLYLISDVALCIDEVINSNKRIRFLSVNDLRNYPVIKQDLPDEEYVRLSEILNNPDERRYNKTLRATYEQLKTGKIESTNDVLSMELLNTVNIFHAEQLNDMLKNDLHELNVCYRNGAYKSVLILAGSILEAVLIDWLSEIDGCNYFTQDYYVPGKNGKLKRANLIDYINAIKRIKKPAWASEASKAHTIREKRNYVHAQLCLNTDEINEDICNMVINYLKEVLVSRGVHVPAEV